GVLPDELVDAAAEAGQVLSSLRIGVVPNEKARQVMPNVRFSISPYGLTEGYGPFAVTSPADPDDRRSTCGRMLEGNELRVVDPGTGLDVKPGEVGEAWLRGIVTRGYWNNPEENKRTIDSDGWFRSGDLVSVDDEGYVSFVGRLKLMLKVGGENVSI